MKSFLSVFLLLFVFSNPSFGWNSGIDWSEEFGRQDSARARAGRDKLCESLLLPKPQQIWFGHNSFDLYHQNEFERRVTLPVAGLAAHGEVLHRLFREFTEAGGTSSPLVLAPKAVLSASPEAGQLTEYEEVYPVEFSSSSTPDVKYFIVRQLIERSEYFDTAFDDLARRGIAVRVKSAYGARDPFPVRPPVYDRKTTLTTFYAGNSHALFIKHTPPKGGNLGIAQKDFTVRKEWFMFMPFSESDPSGYLNLIKSKAPELNPLLTDAMGNAPLRTIKQVEAFRVGFDIVYRPLHRKVGFLVLDTFYSPKDRETPEKGPAHNQYEIELLPSEREFYRHHKGELRAFFASLENAFGGKVTNVPKYLQEF